MTYFISTLFSLLVFNIFNILLLFLIIFVLLYIFYHSNLIKLIIIIIIIIISIIAFSPLGTILISNLEKSSSIPDLTDNNISGIIVLSGGIDENMSNEYQQFYLSGSNNRLIETIILHNRFPSIRIIFSGSTGSHFQKKAHNETVSKFFRKIIKDKSIVEYENSSRNTYESIINLDKKYKLRESSNWILITSAFHMQRVIKISEKQGINFIPFPVDFKTSKSNPKYFSLQIHRNINLFQIGLREHLSTLWLKVLNRI
tara:strand:+ start:30 stop:800 length:771 start_codon:yes stop_codon:yes gene_type:complete